MTIKEAEIKKVGKYIFVGLLYLPQSTASKETGTSVSQAHEMESAKSTNELETDSPPPPSKSITALPTP